MLNVELLKAVQVCLKFSDRRKVLIFEYYHVHPSVVITPTNGTFIRREFG